MYIYNERPMYISHIHVYGYGTIPLMDQIELCHHLTLHIQITVVKLDCVSYVAMHEIV